MRRLQPLKVSFLNQVLGIGLVPAEQKGRTEQTITVLVDEFLHSGRVAPFQPGDHFTLVHAILVPESRERVQRAGPTVSSVSCFTLYDQRSRPLWKPHSLAPFQLRGLQGIAGQRIMRAEAQV